jgi:hypothetical protein
MLSRPIGGHAVALGHVGRVVYWVYNVTIVNTCLIKGMLFFWLTLRCCFLAAFFLS